MGFGKRDRRQGRSPSVAAGPPPPSDLERRVEEALATARASEAAIMTVAAAAFDAAEQAQRAAELAERASSFAARVVGPSAPRVASPLQRPIDVALLPPEPTAGEIRVSVSTPSAAAPSTVTAQPVAVGQPPLSAVEMSSPGFGDERLRSFHLRADCLSSRLRALA